jgi:hypothetical protein
MIMMRATLRLFIAGLPVLGAMAALFLLWHWDRGILDRE